MGLGGSLLVKAAALAAVSASSLPGIPLCPGIHRRFVGPGRALRGDLRWWVTGDRRSIALMLIFTNSLPFYPVDYVPHPGGALQYLTKSEGRCGWA